MTHRCQDQFHTGAGVSAMRKGLDVDARDPRENVRMSTTPVVRFGGKARAARLIWRLLGKVDTFVDPFYGGVSVPLKCPYELRRVVINDRDSLVANFWRAVQFDPEAVAWWADYPTVHDDLIARREWLRQVWPQVRDRMQLDPWLYDAQVAGVWVWAVSNSIDLLQLTIPTPEERKAYSDRQDQPSIGHQAVVVEGDADAIEVIAW